MIGLRKSLRRRFLVSFSILLAGLALLSLAFTLVSLFFYYRSTLGERTREVSRRFQAALSESEDSLLFRTRILADVARVEAVALDARVVREVQVYTLRWLKQDGFEVLGMGDRDYWENRGTAPEALRRAFSGVPSVEFADPEEGPPALVAANPREGPGGVSEVIVAALPLGRDTLARMAGRSGGEIVIETEDGRVLASSLFRPVDLDGEGRAGSSAGIGSVSIDGVHYAHQSFPLSVGHRVCGRYTVLWPVGDLWNLTVRLAVLHLAAAPLAFGLLYLLYRRLIASTAGDIESLTAWGRGFSPQDPTPPPRLARDDEVGVLSHVFSGLVERLETALSEVAVKNRALGEINVSLEQKVDEKTRELEEQRRLLESVLSGMAQCVFLLEGDDTVAYANRTAGEVFGEIEGVCFETVWPGALSPRGGAASEAELVRGGRTYLVNRTPVGDSGRSIVVAQDVSARRALERQLQQSQRLESVGRLAGGVAHDFNNVLGSIVPCVDILRRRVTDPKALSCLDSIDKAAMRAAGVVRQLLTFSRSGEFKPLPLQLNGAVEGALQILSPGLRQVELEWRPGASLPLVRADETQIQQTVLNLVLNAVDAMQGAGTVTVSTEPGQGGNSVRLAVEDEGPGVPAEIADKIFDPFFTTKEPGKGTGLGLSIVYGVVERHGGRIRVLKGARGGARFEIDFPVLRSVAAESAKPSLGRGNLLLVDDDALLVESLAESLREMGFQVVTAQSGPEALEVAKAGGGPLDAVVLDVRMPHMDGAELARRLRALAPKLPILFMTGYADDREAELNRLSGRAPLLKPFAPSRLAEVLNSLLAEREPAGATSADPGPRIG